jgi:hypothetical protein
MLTTDQKGAVAEVAIAAEALKNGVGVLQPLGDERYDLVLDLRPRLVRVQCKWAVQFRDLVVVPRRRTRRGAAGMICRRYRVGEIDAIAAYCEGANQTYLLPLEMSVNRTAVHLRLAPCRNNQSLGVNWARDFELGATLRRLKGPIAQLGERRAGSA